MIRISRHKRKRNKAQAAPEYALLLALMALALAASLTFFGGQIDAFFRGFATMMGAVLSG